MSGYARQGESGQGGQAEAGLDAFARSRQAFEEIVAELEDPESGELTHAELEDCLLPRGRELMRVLCQDCLDLRACRERRLPEGVAGADGVRRTRAEPGHARLALRAMVSNGDFDAYWRYHLQQEHHRVQQSRYQDTYQLIA